MVKLSRAYKDGFLHQNGSLFPRALPFCVNKRRIGARETNLPQLQISFSTIFRYSVLVNENKNYLLKYFFQQKSDCDQSNL